MLAQFVQGWIWGGREEGWNRGPILPPSQNHTLQLLQKAHGSEKLGTLSTCIRVSTMIQCSS